MIARALLLIPLVAASLLARQVVRPLPDHDAFVKATRDNLIRSQREQFNYAYKERRTEFHVNPFGRVGTGGIEGWEVTPIENGKVIQRRLIERDGKRVTDGDVDRIRVQEERRREGRRTSMDDVVAMLTFKIARRETVNGREAIAITFTPKPDGEPETREGRLAKAFTGTAWVDEAAREVIRVEAKAVDTISFGFGLIARLNQGTTVTLNREPITGGIWLPTSIRFAGEGRALLIRRLNVDQRIEWSEYKRVLNVP
jgi:predicted secreted protein